MSVRVNASSPPLMSRKASDRLNKGRSAVPRSARSVLFATQTGLAGKVVAKNRW